MTHLRTIVRHADQALTRAFEEELSKSGLDLTGSQAFVLDAIRRFDRPSQTDIVNETGIDRSTIADVVRRLVKKGLVKRKRTKEDARRYALELTESGTRDATVVATAENRLTASLALKEPTAMKGIEKKIMSVIRAVNGSGSTGSGLVAAE